VAPAALRDFARGQENHRRDAGATLELHRAFTYVRWNENQRPRVIIPSHRMIENVP